MKNVVDVEQLEKFGWWELVKAVWFLLGNKRKIYLFWTFILFLIHFYVVIPPLLLGKIVDFFGSYNVGDPLGTFYFYIGFMGISFVFVSFVRLSLKKLLGDLRSEIVFSLKVSGFENLLDFSIRWHDRENTGNKFQRIQKGLDALTHLAQMLDNDIFQAVTAILGAIGVFIFLEPRYVVFFIFYAGIFLFTLRYFYGKIRRLNDEYHITLEKAAGSYVEGISNILTIKTLGVTKTFKGHIARKEELSKQFEFHMREVYNNLWKVFQIFNGMCYAVFLLFVGQGVITKAVTPGTIVIFYGYLNSLTGSAGELIQIYEDVIKSKSAIGRLMPIFWEKAIVREGTLPFPKQWDRLLIRNAGFQYQSIRDDTDDTTLSNVNLTIERFRRLGIVGKTGSGKSTLAKLLVGLYEFDAGVYSIGNTNFYDISHEQITNSIALVLQDSEMFNFSLKENITLMREMKPDLLEKAVEISQLGEVIAKLPDGIDTLIGEKGYHLSGGERQRVGIARAIYKDPQIIIFDEATSSLDSRTEAFIQKRIEEQLQEKTILIIAHRISTLRNVKNIYVFESGRIVEEGTFQELASNPQSHFSKIYKS